MKLPENKTIFSRVRGGDFSAFAGVVRLQTLFRKDIGENTNIGDDAVHPAQYYMATVYEWQTAFANSFHGRCIQN